MLKEIENRIDEVLNSNKSEFNDSLRKLLVSVVEDALLIQLKHDLELSKINLKDWDNSLNTYSRDDLVMALNDKIEVLEDICNIAHTEVNEFIEEYKDSAVEVTIDHTNSYDPNSWGDMEDVMAYPEGVVKSMLDDLCTRKDKEIYNLKKRLHEDEEYLEEDSKPDIETVRFDGGKRCIFKPLSSGPEQYRHSCIEGYRSAKKYQLRSGKKYLFFSICRQNKYLWSEDQIIEYTLK